MMRVFSGSCVSLDGQDYARPEIVERAHLLGPGSDQFQEGIPLRPHISCHAMNKVFSGSALDLNEAAGDDENGDECADISSGAVSGAPIAGSRVNGNGGLDSPRRQTSNSVGANGEDARARTVVLVVNAAGFLSAHVVARLLAAGYTVRATVTSTQQVKDLFGVVPNAPRLTVSEVATSAPTFRDVIKGCHCVIHCGVTNVAEGEDIVEAHAHAVKALFDAIRAYAKGTVKRVVLTGSSVAVCHVRDVPPAETGTFDETHWNTVASATQDPYQFAKVSFEKEAWRLQKLHDIDVTVLLPSIVLGPSLTNEASEGMRIVQSLASNSPVFPFAPRMYWNFVDVRDVAEAHVQAMESAAAKNQRYILSNVCLPLADVGAIIKRTHPHLTPPTLHAPTLLTLIVAPIFNSRASVKYLWANLGKRRGLSTAKAQRDLAFSPVPFEQTIGDSIQELIVSGHLPSAEQAASQGSSTAVQIVRATVAVAVVGAVGWIAFARFRGLRR